MGLAVLDSLASSLFSRLLRGRTKYDGLLPFSYRDGSKEEKQYETKKRGKNAVTFLRLE